MAEEKNVSKSAAKIDPKIEPKAMAAAAVATVAGSAAAAQAETVKNIESSFREYSVAEFFKKNRQMLGYTGKVRSLTTIVHEAVTNALDACEDANIPPEITVEINTLPNDHVQVIVEDNGTGVPKSKIGQAFAKLLAGTKFHQRMQKRGQQGIGISYAVLFSQITTGKTTRVKTSTDDDKIYECEVSIDITKNEPVISNLRETRNELLPASMAAKSVDRRVHRFRGTRIEFEFAEVNYNRSEYSVYEYLRRSALANPHSQITLIEPTKEIVVFPRATTEIPKKPKKILPHPLGITTSDLMDMVQVTDARKLSSFFTNEFSRFSNDKVKELAAIFPYTKDAKTGVTTGINFEKQPANLQWAEAEAIVKQIQQMKWIAPDMDSLSPIGEAHLEKSLKNLLAPGVMKVCERKPRVFRGGIPFVVEAAVCYGGKAGVDTGEGRKSEVLRFANRTPLLFDAGNCAISEAVKSIDWNRYGLTGFDNQPLTVFVNFVSVYVPYSGAGKLSISPEEEIIAEIRFALMECAREVGTYLRGLEKAEEAEKRRTMFYRYIEEVAIAIGKLTGTAKETIVRKLTKMADERTAIAISEEEGEADKELEQLEKIEDSDSDTE